MRLVAPALPPVAAAALLFLGSALPAAGQTAVIPHTIDDFEAEPVTWFSTSFGLNVSRDPVGTGHLIGEDSGLTATPAGSAITGELTLTPGDDSIEFGLTAGGTMDLWYEFQNAGDLSHGGYHHGIRAYVEVEVEDPSWGARLQVTLYEKDGLAQSIEADLWGGYQSVDFPFADFSSVDVANIEKMTVRTYTLDPEATVRIELIDRYRFGAFLIYYDLTFDSPFTAQWFAQLFGQGRSVSGSDSVELTLAGSTAPAPPELTAYGNGDGRGSTGATAAAAAYWSDPGVYPTSRFDYDVRLQPDAEGIRVTGLPVIVPQTNGVMLRYGVELTDTGEKSIQTMYWDVPPGQTVQMSGVTVEPVDGMVQDGFRIGFDLIAAGGADPGLPLVTMMLTADRAPGGSAPTPAPLLESAGNAEPSHLTARPGVTRTGTTFRLSRPAEIGGSLTVLDVTGRRVRELTVTAGADAVTWDGRDGSGGAVASGVYWAIHERSGADAARVVVIR